MSKVVIVNYYTFENVGGIEKYVCELIEYMINNSVRVIWVCKKKNAVAKSFEKIINNVLVDKVYVNMPKILWFSHEKISLSREDEIVILSFTPIGMARAESIMEEFNGYSITPFYVVPDTTGNSYYLERYFKGQINDYILQKLTAIYQRWESTNNIRFFAPGQMIALKNNYNMQISNENLKLLPSVYEIQKLNKQEILDRAKSRKEKFNIFTVGRFDFPHKGYMLGLVRAFGRLKIKYPQLTLTIVGFGPDMELLSSEISKLDTNAQADLFLTGEVSPQKLEEYLKKSHLNVSVAGAVSEGIRCGVLSIPARNYCEGECEVYGFGFDIEDLTSLKSGCLVDPYIEEAINMSNESYVKQCIHNYELVFNDNKCDPMYFFHTKDICEPFHIDRKEIFFFRRLAFLKKIVIMKDIIKSIISF